MKMRYVFAAAFASLLGTTAAHAEAYVSVLGGPTFAPDLRLNGPKTATDTGFNAGGRVGIPLGISGLAAEADLFYNQSHFSGTDTRIGSLSYMGNLVYHVDTNSPFGIYGGGGVGAVRTDVNGGGFNGSSTVFGWQALGGVDYQWRPKTALFAEYRYQNAHNANLPGPVGNTSNNMSVGVKFGL
jgi:opacity protein-like surface antigen